MIKVFKFLKEFKRNEPIDYIRKGSLGEIVKFINDNISDEELKNSAFEVFKFFESEVINQLFRKKPQQNIDFIMVFNIVLINYF